MILQSCKAHVQTQIQLLRASMDELALAAESESKSTAGDKHETGRAMLQLEQEKTGKQLQETEQRFLELQKIPGDAFTEVVSTGAFVRTTQGSFYIASAIGKITCEGKEIMVISPVSPLARAMMGRRKGKFQFNQQEQEILEIQ